MEPTTPLSPKPAKKGLITTLVDAMTTTTTTGLLRNSSFKEDSYFVHQLKPAERKALDDLKQLLLSSTPAANTSDSSTAATKPSTLSMWGGIPLLSGERGDVILLKFLRARDFSAAQAHSMLIRCAEWRREFGADSVLGEDLGLKELEGVVAYLHGCDRLGRPVCYNAYGVFKDREMYGRVFGDEEKLRRFLRWRVQVMERGVGLLQFKPGGINSIIQVTDLKDMPKRELRVPSNHILSLFQDNYPEMVARKVFINVPWYFSTLYSMFSPFLTQRTKSKFVIAKEGNAAETLYKFIRPEFVPVQYGGLSRPGDLLQDDPPKPATEFTVKGGEKVKLEIDGIEAGATITWDVVVGGWEVDYSAEYIPSDETSYTIVVEKPRRMASADEPVRNSFTSKEAGKMVLSVDNTGSRRRKVAAYRHFVRKAQRLISSPAIA